MRALRVSLVGMVILALLGGPSALVVAQDDPMEPALVTGIISNISHDSDGTLTAVDGGMLKSGVQNTNRWEASDPRLSGTSTVRWNWQQYVVAGFEVDTATRVVENDDGRWVGTSTALDGRRLMALESVILHGEDAYDGLTAYVLIDWQPPSGTFDAAIFPGEMPPFPDLPAE